jgi:hypothetical protein
MGGVNFGELKKSKVIFVFGGDTTTRKEPTMRRYFDHLQVAMSAAKKLKADGISIDNYLWGGCLEKLFFEGHYKVHALWELLNMPKGNIKKKVGKSIETVKSLLNELEREGDHLGHKQGRTWITPAIFHYVKEALGKGKQVALFIFGHGLGEGVHVVPVASSGNIVYKIEQMNLYWLVQYLERYKPLPKKKIFIYVNACFGGGFAETVNVRYFTKDVARLCENWNIHFLSPQDAIKDDEMTHKQFDEFWRIVQKYPKHQDIFSQLVKEKFNFKSISQSRNAAVPWMYPTPNIQPYLRIMQKNKKDYKDNQEALKKLRSNRL